VHSGLTASRKTHPCSIEDPATALAAARGDLRGSHVVADAHAVPEHDIASSVAGVLPELGVMLPSTPLQHLLLDAVGVPLVMTSGNLSSEPIIANEDEAHGSLASIADAFLENDRPILSRYDDSVVRVVDGRTHMIRRARGYAPLPLHVSIDLRTMNRHSSTEGLTMSSPSTNPFPASLPTPPPSPLSSPPPPSPATNPPCILATGAEQKSTFCLAKGDTAFISQHLGDLENANSFSNYVDTLALYQRLFDLKPTVIACDMHPEYLSSKEAHARARAQQLPCFEVQHHHAHIAAVLAEHVITEERVIGFAFDGTGYGDDGSIWGGEVLIASLNSYERFAHLANLPLPGGAAAIKHPDRMAYALLRSCDLLDHPAAQPLLDSLGADRCRLLKQMIERGTNTPLTSSMGRLFDAVSALLGICTEETYDGQPAIELEAAIYAEERAEYEAGDAPRPDYTMSISSSVPLVIDPTPLIRALLDDCAAKTPPPLIARRFHDAIAALIVAVAKAARKATGLNTVALSGGVFMNRSLVVSVMPLLEQADFTVLLHKDLPANDGCISYGQAAVATARLASGMISDILDSHLSS